MNWIQLKITTKGQGIDPICAELYDLGITGIEISDKDDFKEFLENNRKYWDYVDEELERLKSADSCITLYFEDSPEGAQQIESVKDSLNRLDRDFGIMFAEAFMKDEDWSENWKKYYKPIEVGEKIVIVPEWESAPKTSRTKFIINPGCSFGTGSHESTRMCIEEIEKNLRQGDKVLDLGCGSGILSVIALLLGASEAYAVDIDPIAVETAYSNLKLNNLSELVYHGFSGDVTSDKNLHQTLSQNKCRMVIANIVADVIINLLPYVKDFIEEGGVFICSGIIIDRKDEVKATIENYGFKIKAERVMGEWAAFTVLV